MALAIGQEVDGYLIQEVLGQGGMGIVYKAEDVALSRQVALKVINPSMTRDEQFVRRFQSEARTLARVNSPNIVAIHAFRKTEHGLFIVMEYVEGGDLSDCVQQGAMPIARAIPIIKQLLRAFQDAHSAGVVHRDIKPPNIMLSKTDEVKVTDFGLAKMSTADMTKTMSQGIMGTLYYMSPEQVRGEEVDQRSDLWSLGVVFYELLVGSRPFDAAYEASVMYAIMNEPVTFPDRAKDQIPEEIRSIILRVLEKDRDRRYHDATEMLVDIDAFEAQNVSETMTRAMPRAAPRGTTAPKPKSSSGGLSKAMQVRWPARWALGIVAVVILTAGSLYLFGRNTSPAPVEEAAAVVTAPTTLSLDTSPPGARVSVDGESIGESPISNFEMIDGRETVRVRLEQTGYVSIDTLLLSNIAHSISLRPVDRPRPTPAVRKATVIVDAIPNGSVFVDDRPVASSDPIEVDAGSRNISCRSVAYGNVQTRISLPANQTTRLSCIFEGKFIVQSRFENDDISARIYINGEETQLYTPQEIYLGPGTYTFSVSKPLYSASLVSGPSEPVTIQKMFGEQETYRFVFELTKEGN